MKTILFTIIFIIALLWVGDLTITFKPFSISLPGWYKPVGIILFVLSMAVYTIGEYTKGYKPVSYTHLIRPHPSKEAGWIVDLCGNKKRFGEVKDLRLVDSGNGKWAVYSNNRQLTNVCLLYTSCFS